MKTIEELIQHYKSNPPRLSFKGSEGTGWGALAFKKYPQEEADKFLGDGVVVVWRGKFDATRADLTIERYCVVNVYLDTSGCCIPEALPLLPEMEGHAIDAIIYVDMFGCIRAKAIGGATSHAKRNSLFEKCT